MVNLSSFSDFAAVSRPFRADVEIQDVEVEGTIPKELDGTFYRVCRVNSFLQERFMSDLFPR